MNSGNEGIQTKFDELEEQVDFLIALCQSLEEENQALKSKIKGIETELEQKVETQEVYAEQETMIQAKIDGLLSKLDGFATSMSQNEPSKV